MDINLIKQRFALTAGTMFVPAVIGAAEHSAIGLFCGGIAAYLTWKFYPDVYAQIRAALPMLPERVVEGSVEEPEQPQKTTVQEPSQQHHEEVVEESHSFVKLKELPAMVRYSDIQMLVPQNHVLVGISDYGSVETREQSIKGLVWVVGGSGSGKSNTVALRVQEDYERNHYFLGIDPHAYKDDSLTYAVAPYQDRFLVPIARQPEDILNVLQRFLAEFERRKNGGDCYPLTLLIDEVGSLTMDKPEDETEEQIIAKVKQVARIAGQEIRGFNMAVTMISQDAAYLSWLRKRALMVLGHKVMMMSERELVCNKHMEIARDMDNWPVGRTIVYGIAFSGVQVLQQPLFDHQKPALPQMPALPIRNTTWKLPEVALQANGSEVEGSGSEEDGSPQKKILQDIGKRLQKGEARDSIIRSFGVTGGRAYQEIGSAIDLIDEIRSLY